ncbi:MAG: oligosaccharide flippase family protein [Alphaproteobacteria bacterium]
MVQDKPTPSRSAAGAALGAWGRTIASVRRWFEDGLLRRIFKNAGLLLSGKTLAGLFGLGYLALTARALGPEIFGILVLIHTYVQVAGGITKFQSWQAVIRYGAECVEQKRREDFQRLIKFTTLLDLGGALLGAIAAAALAPLVGPWLGWSEETVTLAMIYSLLILFGITATPTGILRLFDRFDLLAVQAAIAPGLRLVGAIVAYLAGAGLWAFLLVWLISGAVGGLVLLAMGWRELERQGMTAGMGLSLRGLTKPHAGLWRFVWLTNFHTSLGLVTGHLTTLTVGLMLGPSAAGLFRIAKEFASVVAKPAGLLTRAIYPELAKLATKESGRDIGRLVLRSGVIAGGGAALILVAVIVVGEPVLRLVFGEMFLESYAVLLLLVIATTVNVCGFALDPTMYALGRPDIPFRVNILITLLYFPLLLYLLAQLELVGAGFAAIASASVTFTVMAATAARLLSRDRLAPAE